MDWLTVVMSVYRGELPEQPNFTDLKEKCKRENIYFKEHTSRPRMVCIKLNYMNNKMTLIMFHSTRFRLMGPFRSKAIAYLAVNDFLRIQPISLKLQTQTCRFRINALQPHDEQRFLTHDKECRWLPELFTAIEFLRWSPIHVNLFFTGSVIILGKEAYEKAPEIRKYLEDLQSKAATTIVKVEKPSTMPTPLEVARSEDETVLLSYLPKDIHQKALYYFHSYPLRLIRMWRRRIVKDSLLRKQLYDNILMF